MSSNARQLAVDALMRWESTRHYADDILGSVTRGRQLSSADRALVQMLFYGVLRNLTQLDALIGELREGKIDRESRQILRIGMHQLFNTEIPDHAAVSETVALARKKSRGFVNGILRNATRRRDELREDLASSPMDIRYSHPEFLIERWIRQFGEEATEKLCIHNNLPSSVFLRVNSLVPEAAAAVAESEQTEALDEDFPGFYKIDGPIPREWIEKGYIYVQDPATSLSCILLDAQPGETVLDACAAPGGKTTFMAAAMENTGSIVACDSVDDRMEKLRNNIERLRVTNTQLREIEWGGEAEVADLPQFDAILLDVPCTNSGVMQRRVDVRWRLQPEEFELMPKTQLSIIDSVLPFLKSGGRLIYSTCSIDVTENEDVVNEVVDRHDDISVEQALLSLPWDTGYDGAFAACLRKV